MNIFDRFKAWVAAGRAKSAQAEAEALTLTQLLDFLGIHDTSGAALSEATYFACIKVLNETSLL